MWLDATKRQQRISILENWKAIIVSDSVRRCRQERRSNGIKQKSNDIWGWCGMENGSSWHRRRKWVETKEKWSGGGGGGDMGREVVIQSTEMRKRAYIKGGMEDEQRVEWGWRHQNPSNGVRQRRNEMRWLCAMRNGNACHKSWEMNSYKGEMICDGSTGWWKVLVAWESEMCSLYRIRNGNKWHKDEKMSWDKGGVKCDRIMWWDVVIQATKMRSLAEIKEEMKGYHSADREMGIHATKR